MAEIFPFCGYRYNPGRVQLEDVLTQPYDKITTAMQERYYGLSPYNLIAVEKGRAAPDDTSQNNIYTRAAQKLNEWLALGILERDPAPAIYVSSQDYRVPGTTIRKLRKGFVALSRVVDYAVGVVHRHEQTLAGPKADRLELLRHTRTQTGQLFMLYSDPSRRIDALLDQASRMPPAAEVRDEYGVVHRLWPVTDTQMIQCFVTEMENQKLIIADGHHRYETALAYRNESRQSQGASDPNAPHELAMMTFINSQAEGLTILPTHRVVSKIGNFQLLEFQKGLEPYFDWYAYPFSSDAERATAYDEFRKDLAGRARQRRTIAVYAGAKAFYLFLLRQQAELDACLSEVPPAQRQLDVVLLHRLMLEKGLGITADAVAKEASISYEREMDAAIAAVDRGEAELCCLLNPVRIEQVREIALTGGVLPQKSTDFYPKLLSGLVLYRLDG